MPATQLSRDVKILLLLSTIFFISSIASALNITRVDTIAITVQVAERTLVDVSPSSLSWTGANAVDPGSTGIEQGFQIENIGSTNISYIWFNTTYPSTKPFGSGQPSLYNPGNFVIIRKNISGAYFFFVNLVEYNETRPIYVTPAAGCTNVGRFREGGEEFFWCLDPDDVSGQCNTTSGTQYLYIGKTAHNQTQTGTVDLSLACDAGLTASGGQDCRFGNMEGVGGTNNGYGWADVVVGQNGAGKNYTAAIRFDCTQVIFYHWNKDSPGATDPANNHAEYFISPAVTGALAPGGSVVGNMRVKVPYGTPVGTLSNGVLTVMAMAVDVNA